MLEERSGRSYYLARIEFTAEGMASLQDKMIKPGMPAEVLIVTGERTPLEYLVAPIRQSFNRAMRES